MPAYNFVTMSGASRCVVPKKKICLFIMILFACSSLFFGPYLWHNIHSAFLSSQEIAATSAAISLNETDTLIIMNRIADWLRINIKRDAKKYHYFPFYWRKTRPSANWVMSTRRGACEETAVLFAELARNVGINTRVTFNTGEDHVWNEVWINGSWRHFDATLKEVDRFDNPGFYERSKDDGGWGKRISYVYSIDLNGLITNVTDRYTNTGKLIVSVERDGFPTENVKVVVKSKYLMESHPDSYREPLIAVEAYTHNGNCSFNLGQNNYTVFAQIGNLGAESDVSLLENNSTTVALHLAEFDAPFSFSSMFALIFVVCTDVIIAIAVSLITYYVLVKILVRSQRMRACLFT